MAITSSDIEYHVAGVRYAGLLYDDDQRGHDRPGVLVAPAAMGLGPNAKAVAHRLAELGYVAFAMDYYGDGASPPHDVRAPRLNALRADVDKARAIGLEALRVLTSRPQTDPDRVAAIGHCYGGALALELARAGADLKAVVAFHAELATPRPKDAQAIRGKVLAIIGSEDPLVPRADRTAFEQEMTDGGIDWRLYVLGGVGHSYTNPSVLPGGEPGMAYNAAADRRSWIAMLDLLREVFDDPSRNAGDVALSRGR